MEGTKLLCQPSQLVSKYPGPLALVEALVSNLWHLSIVYKTEVCEHIDSFLQ
jgi:hypothetical protein